MSAIPEPIFIQALWRSGSTYLWNKFRERPEICGFFEPLHESLFCKTKERLLEDYERASKKFEHNTVAHNYYDEFNIRAEGGVKHFQRRFTLERYALAPDEEDVELAHYIQSLIDQAAEGAQQAVLQFNRGILRARWMKEQFGGTHIYLNRSPHDMLSSYRRKGYYLPTYLAIIGQNSAHPIFAPAAKHFNLTPYDDSGISDKRKFMATLTHYSRAMRKLNEQDEQDLVGFFWFLGLAEATNYADIIVDTDQLLEAEAAVIPEIIGRKTGMDLDFSDFRMYEPKNIPFEISTAMKQIIHDATEVVNPQWSELIKFPLSRNTETYIMDALS